jgi:hypothetical protein
MKAPRSLERIDAPQDDPAMKVTSPQAWIAVGLISVFFVVALILLYLWRVQPLAEAVK